MMQATGCGTRTHIKIWLLSPVGKVTIDIRPWDELLLESQIFMSSGSGREWWKHDARPEMQRFVPFSNAFNVISATNLSAQQYFK